MGTRRGRARSNVRIRRSFGAELRKNSSPGTFCRGLGTPLYMPPRRLAVDRIQRGNLRGSVRTVHRPTCRSRASDFCINGRDFQVIGTRDVGPQRQLEQRLQESQKMEAVGRLLGGVAHDFNNLLTGVMLYCDLLMAELEKDSRSYRHAREMRHAGEQSAELVRQLLAVVRPQAMESRVFALNVVVAGAEHLLVRLIGENIVFHTSLAHDLGSVRMDPARLQQILLNLVLNARDAMPNGGQITLTTRNCTVALPGVPDRKPELMPCVELTVADNGCGMDAETLSRAFEPFFTTKKSGRGNGLGTGECVQPGEAGWWNHAGGKHAGNRNPYFRAAAQESNPGTWSTPIRDTEITRTTAKPGNSAKPGHAIKFEEPRGDFIMTTAIMGSAPNPAPDRGIEIS